MAHFLDNIEFLTASQRLLLKGTAAETPVALSSAMQANPAAYEAFLGHPIFQKLGSALDQLMSPAERMTLRTARRANYSLGVAEDRGKPGIVTTSLHRKRDQVYRELHKLQTAADDSVASKERIAKLRKLLAKLLNRDAA